jgi:predicted phosphodiesterase
MLTRLILLAGLAQAAPVEHELRALFDAGRGGAVLERLRPAAPASVAGVPEAIPPDLIEARGTWGSEAQLAKLRSAPAQETFTFAVIGDMENGRFPWQRIFAPKGAGTALMKMIHAGPSQFVMQLGDFVSKGNVDNYREFLRFLAKRVTLPVFPVIGNHDRSQPNGDADKTLYDAVFGQKDFFFDHNGWRFIALDTSDRKLTPAQLAWLEQAIEGGPPSLIFTHVPPRYLHKRIKSYSPKGAEAEALSMSGYFTEGSEEFDRLMARGLVKRVYMGHIHAFGLAEKDGLRYVLTAGGGSPHYPLPPGYPKRKFAHYVQVTAGPTGLTETVFEMDGASYVLPPVGAAGL